MYVCIRIPSVEGEIRLTFTIAPPICLLLVTIFGSTRTFTSKNPDSIIIGEGSRVSEEKARAFEPGRRLGTRASLEARCDLYCEGRKYQEPIRAESKKGNKTIHEGHTVFSLVLDHPSLVLDHFLTLKIINLEKAHLTRLLAHDE